MEQQATRVTVDEVDTRLSRGEPLVFLDVRNTKAWGESDVQATHAIRVPLDDIEKHLNEIPRNRTIITYCT